MDEGDLARLYLKCLDQVGRYQISEELGRGAHGVVYKALDPAIGRSIAIKAIAIGEINAVDRERVREAILGEARLAGTLSHPNIVAVYDVVDEEAQVFIVMEFVDGESLEHGIELLKEKRAGVLSRAGSLLVLRQVAEALDYAHRKGVIHRDVKPANILLKAPRPDQTGELVAKIADFGVAKFASQEVTRQMDGGPAMVGTPNYMSPEQVEGIPLTGASDQFSLAVITYEILTGQRAFSADTLEELLHRIRFESEEAVSILNPALSRTVSRVMLKALAKKPADRFQNCAEFVGAMEFALGDSPRWTPGMVDAVVDEPQIRSPVLPEETSPAMENGWGKKLVMLLGLCLAVGLAIVMIVRMNSGSAIPTQVLDTRSGPASPPPGSTTTPTTPIDELNVERRSPSTPVPSSIKPAGPSRLDNSPTLVAVPDEKATAKPVASQKVSVTKSSLRIRSVQEVKRSTEVQLSSDPPNANVLVDGVNSCQTPCSFTLSPGRHTMAANLAGFATARKIFQVPQDPSVFVQLNKSIGVLLVSSEPSGANVKADGEAIGKTPVTLRLAPGTHRLSVFDGTTWHDESVLVTSDEVHTRLFRF